MGDTWVSKPPLDAWDLLDEFGKRLDGLVRQIVEEVGSSGESEVSLPYWRTQQEHDSVWKNGNPFGLENRAALEAARELTSEVRISFHYIDDDGALTALN